MTIVIGAINNNQELIFAGDRCVSNGRKNISAVPKVWKQGTGQCKI